MTIEAREIDFFNLRAILKLMVRSNQEHLVANNAITIAQDRYEPAGWTRGLWEGGTPVGLIAMINPQIKSSSFEEGDRLDAAYLWRLMIADEHQGKGYGAQAIDIAFKQAHVWGLPKLNVSVVPGDNCPMPFYERLGFKQTGAKFGEEVELLADVPA